MFAQQAIEVRTPRLHPCLLKWMRGKNIGGLASKDDDSGLAELRERWSRSAKTDSINFLASHANPTRSH